MGHRGSGRTGWTLVISLLLVAGCGGSSSSDDSTAYEFDGATAAGQVIATDQRSPAPEFAGELLDGGSFTSDELQGDIAVINFWGSWCPPCRVESPDLQTVYAQLADQDVQFLGVDVKDQRQLAVAFLADVGVQYPSVFDPDGEVALAFRGFPANTIPSTIILDRSGEVAAVYTGAITRADLTQALTTLLQESPATAGTP